MASILKVNTIQDATNSNTAMTIDSSGRVLTPAKPSFCAYEDSGGHQIDATNTIRYQTTTCNVGNHYNTSTYKFTAPVAGAYYFSFTAWSNSSSLSRTGFFQNNTADQILPKQFHLLLESHDLPSINFVCFLKHLPF